MMGATKYGDLALYKRLLHQARPYWSQIAGILVLRLLSIPLALLLPLPLKIAVDSAIGSHPLPASLDRFLPTAVPHSNTAMLLIAVGLLVVISLLVYLRGLGSWLLETYTGEKLVLSFRAQLFRHVQRLSLSYHDARGASDSTYRIQYDAPSIQYIAVHGIIPVVTAGFTLVGMIYVTARIDWQLALVAIAVSPVLFVFTRIFQRRIRSEWSKVKDIESYTMAVIQETVAALRVVKAFGQEDREKERFVHHSEKGVRGQIRLALTNGAFDLLIGLTIAAGTAVALFIGVRHVQSGDLSLGNLLLVMAYLAQLYNPLQTVSRKIADLQASLVSAERAFTILDEAQDVVEKPDARRLSRASGGVSFCNVSFAYSNGQQVLRNISYDIPPGARVGIMGATGAGKTTLINLLTRFYDPTGGRILLDGIDLRDYKLVDLRNQFAIVLQEPVLFSTCIAENIAYARPGASDLDIIEAAKAANAHEFVVRLPQGYETQVGERGMSLSGGERQRISLARAFLKDAPILILDEPTSSVDVSTEAAIVEAMERLMRGRTTFIISHRQSTLKNCDVLLVIEDGRLVSLTSAVPTAASAAIVARGRDASLLEEAGSESCFPRIEEVP
jgi:ATP-binding cassette subfamily B protein